MTAVYFRPMGRKNRQQHPASNSDDDPVLVLNRQRFRRVNKKALAQFARQVLAAIGRDQARVTITLVRDRVIQPLNRTYRDADRPTDVLAFPDEPDFPHEAHDGPYLGDVVISTETAARAAMRLGVSLDRELRNLIIHGLLHLCGYDHETDEGHMRRLERRLRRRLIQEPSAVGSDR